VVVDEEEHSMEVIVADDQLSFAIGRRGNNVKLASKLTGWKIDVRSIAAAEEEARVARQKLEAIPGLQFTHAELLFQEGYRSATEVANALPEDLAELEGFDLDLANSIVKSAKEVVAAGGDVAPRAASKIDGDSLFGTELSALVIPGYLQDKLEDAGYFSVQGLADLSEDDIAAIDGFDVEDAAILQNALDEFFGKNKPTHS
jgi:hypothetical protein